MAVTITLKKSSVANKRPLASSLVTGELALNSNSLSTGIFLLDDSNNVVKVGPTAVGPSAPNITPVGSPGNSVGETWFDTSSSTLYVWDGFSWRSGGNAAYATLAEMNGVTTTASATSGATTLTVASGVGVNNGDSVVGEGIIPGTTVVSGGGSTSIVLSAAIGATLSSDIVTFYINTKSVNPGLSGQGLPKAWVSWDNGVAGVWAGGASTVFRANGSTTATVTTTNNHGLITDNVINATSGVVAQIYLATVTGPKTFTFTTSASTLLNNVAITFGVLTIRSAYNVGSVAGNVNTSPVTVNFSSYLPHANYAVTGMAGQVGGSLSVASPASTTTSRTSFILALAGSRVNGAAFFA